MSEIVCSIIVPYYNVESVLVDRCLRSIVCQEWGGICYEVVLVDDGSPLPLADSTKAIIDEFAHFTFIHQDNRGLSAARNAGLNVAQGRYVFFLDSDDYWFHNAISPLLKILSESEHSIVKFVSEHISDSDDVRLSTKDVPSLATTHYSSGCEYMSRCNIIKGACTYCYERHFLVDNELLMPEGIIHEDEWFLTKAFFAARDVLVTNVPLYAYIRREGSITSLKTKEQWHRSFSHFFHSIRLVGELRRDVARTPIQHSALDYRLSYLLLDYVYNVMNSPLSRDEKLSHLDALHEEGLLPLPKIKGNRRYAMMRVCSKSYFGLQAFAKGVALIQRLRSHSRKY